MTTPWLIYLEHDAWRIITRGDENLGQRHTLEGKDWIEQAAAIAEALHEAGYEGEPIALGLAGSWCLAATVPLPNRQLLRRREAMRYYVEEHFPWSAEENVIDYAAVGQEAFVVATRIEPLRELLSELDKLDIQVASVTPLACLATGELAEEALPRAVIWQTEGATDLLRLDGKQIREWNHVPGESDQLVTHLQMQSLVSSENEELLLCNADDSLAKILRQAGFNIKTSDHNYLEMARRHWERIVAGSHEPTIELRRDELASTQKSSRLSKELTRLQLAAALAMLLVSAGFWARADQYQANSDALRENLVDRYQEVFPAADLPPNIVSTLTIEQHKLEGTRAVDTALPTSIESDWVLEQVLSGLPDKLRFRMPEIQVDATHVSLAGEVRSNADADALASSLRKVGFEVEPPKLQRLAEKGFSVRLTANLPEIRKTLSAPDPQ